MSGSLIFQGNPKNLGPSQSERCTGNKELKLGSKWQLGSPRGNERIWVVEGARTGVSL